MALDPRGLYELAAPHPAVQRPVLLHLMDGASDAGSAVQLARAHLLDALDGEVIARFDVDQLYDYRARRPLMRFARDHWESMARPELALHLMRDLTGAAFLLLVGPEPDVQWERFITAVHQLAAILDVRLVLGASAFPMSLPHTRPTPVIVHASRPDLLAGYRPWLGAVGVPATIGHAIEFRLAEAGLDTMGLSATIPPYLAQAEYPAAAAALLREVALRTGLAFPLDALDAAAQTARLAIDKQIAQSAEAQSLVRALEEQYDSYSRQRESRLDADRLPSADELGAELERFLAEQPRGDTPNT
ncbi:MAG: PAC2 family protein [Frankiaceae bacterium]|nr:PAC2 family protein [Frankiaceae bacterium]